MTVVRNLLSKWEQMSQPTNKSHIRSYSDLEIHLSETARDTRAIRLNSVKSNVRGKKNFSSFVEWLIKESDAQDITITLAVDTFDSWYKDDCLNREQLKNYFSKKGFEIRFKYPDDAGYEMVRWPKSAS